MLFRSPETLTQGLLAWDGWHYRSLLRLGYAAAPEGDARFFPLYPWIARSIRPLIGTTASLLIVANVAAFIAIMLVHRIAKDETGDERLARRAAWCVAVLPPMFVMTMAYSEALFIALTAGGFLAARKQRWLTAAVLGFAASLARPVGVLLVIPFAIEVWRSWRGSRAATRASALLAAGSPALGLGAFLGLMQHVFGDYFTPFRIQTTTGLRGRPIDPVTAFVRSLNTLVSGDHFGIGLHAVWLCIFAIFIISAGRRLPASFTVYAAAVTVVAFSSENLASFERYVAAAFPIAIGASAMVCRADDRIDIWPSALAISTVAMFALSVVAFLGTFVP